MAWVVLVLVLVLVVSFFLLWLGEPGLEGVDGDGGRLGEKLCHVSHLVKCRPGKCSEGWTPEAHGPRAGRGDQEH